MSCVWSRDLTRPHSSFFSSCRVNDLQAVIIGESPLSSDVQLLHLICICRREIFSTHHKMAGTNKRKLVHEDEDLVAEALDQPRKLPALGMHNSVRPFATSRTTLNQATLGTIMSYSDLSTLATQPVVPPPFPLTKPDPPRLGTMARTRTTRASSAPPKPSNMPTRPPIPRIPSDTIPTATSTSRARQTQISSAAPGRALQVNRLAREMDVERTKLAELAADHRALSRELAGAKELDLDKRRTLVDAADELERMRVKHQREIVELEVEVARRAREAREREDELRTLKEDLESTREMVATLKSTMAQQASVQITLNAQVGVLQAEKSALVTQLDELSASISKGALDYRDARKKIERLEAEAREAEMVRRKLHNMVQELKGNIRVFCRVRPVLPHDFVLPPQARACRTDEKPNSEEEDRGSVADMSFPDTRDHKEIVVTSIGLSATGQERKEVYNFNFDRVGFLMCKYNFSHRD